MGIIVSKPVKVPVNWSFLIVDSVREENGENLLCRILNRLKYLVRIATKDAMAHLGQFIEHKHQTPLSR